MFSGNGEKFTETLEREVEANHPRPQLVGDRARGRAGQSHRRDRRLHRAARLALPDADARPAQARDRHGQRRDDNRGAAAVPASSGSTFTCSARRPTGATINLIANQPRRAVRGQGCRMGVAFDGDGDRAIFVDASRAGRRRRRGAADVRAPPERGGRLKGNAIVATVMSNIGLEIALRDERIDMVRCAVGDKYVMEEMISATLASAASSRGTSSSPTTCSPATASSRRSSVLRVWRKRRELADSPRSS